MNNAAPLLLLGVFAGGACADSIIVSTTVDTISPDGACSLREAIIASNLNRSGDVTADDCFGTGVDDISLARGLGTVITVASNLPVITEQVSIAGPSARLVINGQGFHIPPSGVGLTIASTAPFTTLRNLVIQDCDTGILVQGAGSIITSSYIGTDATGTSGVSNGIGIDVQASDVRIGGTTGVTPGGACTGDCNLIAGNSMGVLVSSASGTLIRGNHFGTNAAGTAAISGNTGMRFTGTSQGFTIGGTLPGAGNLVSGHVTGISLSLTPVPFAANSAIEGNYIGTNAAGSAALPNQNGIIVGTSDTVFPLTIGGSLTTATNLISGNTNGILVSHANNVVIQGNRIGTNATGNAAVPNSSVGVLLSISAIRNLVGGTLPGEANVIAYNGTGVRVAMGDVSNSIRGNSIHDNAGKGIQLDDQQSGTAVPPVIGGIAFGVASGSSCAGCTVDLYSDDADEGRKYEGATTADGFGFWLRGYMAGPQVTATATNADHATSEFSVPVVLADPDTDNDGVIDDVDNCVLDPNPTQLDVGLDGYGNICDADLNDTDLVTATDFFILRGVLNQPADSSKTAGMADLNGSGTVTTADYGLLRARLNTRPGPSGLR